MSHRLIECFFGLAGTFKVHLVQPAAMCRDIFHYIRLLKAPPNMALNSSRDGVSIIPLGNLFQCFTTLIVKYNIVKYNPYIQSKFNLFSFVKQEHFECGL